MKLIEIKAEIERYPSEIRERMRGARIFDSSSSPEAKVFFIDKDGGYFLKTAEKGLLRKEAALGEYFHKKSLAPEVLYYASYENDFLVTRKAQGLDLTAEIYLENPKKLAVKMGELLRELHSFDYSDCPEKNRMKSYFELLDKNYRENRFDLSFGNFKSKEDAYLAAKEGVSVLKNDTLIHGDFCLPNILFNEWNFSSFIDLGGAGVGDRHIDIFWGAWTLKFNLKTDAYRDLFLSAYGKDRIDAYALTAVSAIEIFG